MLVIQTCVTNTCRFDACQESVEIFEWNTELNLYLTIPALKPNDLNKTLKHIMGYSDADWAGDPVTRKSTSCTPHYVDQFLLTSECRGQGTIALSSGESELYALGALSAGIFRLTLACSRCGNADGRNP